MRKILGRISVFMVGLAISISLPAFSAQGSQDTTEVWIPQSDFLGSDPDGLFLLVFDISGSLNSSRNQELIEDFKDIYFELSAKEKGVAHEALIFDESVKILKKKKNLDDWTSEKNTDLKEAFRSICNYIGTSKIIGKKRVRLLMISDFYDSAIGEEYQKMKANPQISSSAEKAIEDRTADIDAMAEKMKGIMPDQFNHDYILFPFVWEEKNGNKRYQIEKNAGADSLLIIEKEEDGSIKDLDGSIKRRFIELLMKGLTGDSEVEWIALREIMNEDETVRIPGDYYLYWEDRYSLSEKPDSRLDDLCDFRTGGHLYYAHHLPVKDLKCLPTTEGIYMLMVPEIKITFSYFMADSSDVLQEGSVIVRMDMEKIGGNKSSSSIDITEIGEGPVTLLFSRLSDKNDAKWGSVSFSFNQGKRDVKFLKEGIYQISLRKMSDGSRLDLVIEDNFKILKRK